MVIVPTTIHVHQLYIHLAKSSHMVGTSSVSRQE